jgi:hypothetical protein
MKAVVNHYQKIRQASPAGCAGGPGGTIPLQTIDTRSMMNELLKCQFLNWQYSYYMPVFFTILPTFANSSSTRVSS